MKRELARYAVIAADSVMDLTRSGLQLVIIALLVGA